ncbi:aarF domain-containing kinase [Babesia microti strain RI]|uniref:AarF domain-containing kinase n=1 Tax=Babesia microti (strain RI) TaxID=1133968 RepID=A0A1N6LWL7_BABMR|nr:aarF domain-containing kinase [Babesia microti strain RI]SIO73256.1 aarF domain-containing kinase [Babesia microti strain RI]|eukprot:XP_021337362.1 aarF domain-containing kinase [Babesia microti strain RI]
MYRNNIPRHISSILPTKCARNSYFYFPKHILYPGIINKRLCRSLNSLFSITQRLILSFYNDGADSCSAYGDKHKDFTAQNGKFDKNLRSGLGSFSAFNPDIQSKLQNLKNYSRKLTTSGTISSHCFLNAEQNHNHIQNTFGVGKCHYSSDRIMKGSNLSVSKTSRALQITDLVVGMITGATFDTIKRIAKGQRTNWKESFLSEANMNRLTDSVCKMRGAALKLCQFLSMQQNALPQPLLDALANARNRADFMPQEQVLHILTSEFGDNWRDKFDQFDLTPIASASIGQVHLANVKGRQVAVKIQFPGVSDSIVSDIDNFIKLCDILHLVPESMFIDIFGKEIKSELLSECHYLNEAEFYRIFKQLLGGLDGFYVPDVLSGLTTNKILTTEFVTGISLDQAATILSQDKRNSIGSRLLKLVLNELFAFQLMNTDPNPRNFIYDIENDIINLIDFGAVRHYNEKFINDYREIVKASILGDKEMIKKLSYSLGFLCEKDTDEMIDTHINSVLLIGEPLRNDEYDFRNNEIIENIRAKTAKMIKIRSKPPPPEVYTLHRKLAGCYLLCHNLSAKIYTAYCKQILEID